MRRHLLSVDDLSRDDIERILGRAESFAEVSGREIKKVPPHARSSTRSAITTSSTPSISSTRTLTRSPRAVGRFLPT